MDIGVLTVPFGDQPLDETCEYLAGLGVDTVELGCGGSPGNDHLAREEYLDDEDAQADLHDLLDEHDLRISALATHNNPIHPDDDQAETADEELREAIELAAQLGVDTVTTFSGLPGGGPNDEVPNWITAPWPTEHKEAHDYQWGVAEEYWTDLADFADDHGVNVGIEMHPNMLVYEPTGMERLREATNDRIGANFDPSHLYWQGIDVPAAIRYLGDAIHHAHAKDTGLYESNARVKGHLDTTPYTEEEDRSWLFRTVGYGHGESHWKEVVSTLRMVGYDGALSIEHEDSLTSSREGLEKAVDVLDRAVFETTPGDAYWAE
ncbi:sugar phosphate isomerase/epimerase family protein [Halococcus saccharolyticus]|uniref:AP-endonuclease/AP-lyase/xylose isomerase domain-containing protein n=1 Tax=Halococcus saccharolyticus DSM 5350 TaxID=1227455 RepID=M0MGZ3_9EURY|nr:sugar phosphate isomerase/epimerase [Halococcus saccharolyticus]EMA44981.1 AP-endonuclease/AP-lyase/xylose isomerase domain-containing protein [Halococcus saccharolyticus DSM 5350]